MTPKLRNCTPFVPVSDVLRASRFFHEVLEFELGATQDGYAYLHSGPAAIRLIQAEPDVDLADPARQLSCYVDVDGVDALYARLKPKLDLLSEGHVRAPFTQDYGQREFHVIYEALLIFFGEAA